VDDVRAEEEEAEVRLPLRVPWPFDRMNDETRRESDDKWVRLDWFFDRLIRWQWTLLVAKAVLLLGIMAVLGAADLVKEYLG
jgi:hypothetical protein